MNASQLSLAEQATAISMLALSAPPAPERPPSSTVTRSAPERALAALAPKWPSCRHSTQFHSDYLLTF
jgi:hypothetical protein